MGKKNKPKINRENNEQLASYITDYLIENAYGLEDVIYDSFISREDIEDNIKEALERLDDEE